MKTADLVDMQLDYFVAASIGLSVGFVKCKSRMKPCHWITVYDGDDDFPIPKYSTDWSAGGPIIEEHRILLQPSLDRPNVWLAQEKFGCGHFKYGSTALIAAMRCFVSTKLGDEVDLPFEFQL